MRPQRHRKVDWTRCHTVIRPREQAVATGGRIGLSAFERGAGVAVRQLRMGADRRKRRMKLASNPSDLYPRVFRVARHSWRGGRSMRASGRSTPFRSATLPPTGTVRSTIRPLAAVREW